MPNPSNTKTIYQNQIAVAHVMRIYYAQLATDIWGDIPYSQSFKGLDDLNPAFDKQSDLYPALLAELNAAISSIDADLPGFSGGGDILYSGDMTQWKKFANSLKLRLAIRMSDVKSAEAKTAIEEAVASGVFESNSDNAYFTYGGSAPDNHPLNEDRKTRRDFSSSTTMVDYLKTTGDPRLFKYYDPKSGGTEGNDDYIGRPYGQTGGDASAMPRSAVSQPSGYNLYSVGSFRPTDVLRPDANAIYMDYAEVCFILAEAAARGYSVPGDAPTWYANGIELQ